MYKIALSKKVRKFLAKHKDIARLFFKKLHHFATNPFNDVFDIVPIKWKKWHYRLRIWKYRFLYEVREKEILIYFYEVDSRWDIYKRI